MTGPGRARFDFAGKRVLVTGSTRGIGLALARAFLRAGAEVIVHGRDTARAETLAAELDPVRARGIGFDATDPEAAADAVQPIARAGLDVLVSNAGFQNRTPVAALDIGTYRQMLEGNLVAHFALARAVAEPMAARGGGAIVLVASILALHGRAGLSAYCSAKSGMLGLIRVLAAEYAARGVRINGVGPGFIATDMTADVAAAPGFGDKVIERTPARRWGQAEEMAGPVMFLASDAASFVHGHVVYADGGLTAAF
jgi:Dehydrogenases with different specificities (related to short-chain alcohol dehydrogenases)